MITTLAIAATLHLIYAPTAACAETPTPPTSPLLTDPRWVNVRVQPMSLLFGIFGASLDFDLSRILQLGPSFNWFGSDASGRWISVRQYGLSLTYFPFGHEDGGLFARPTVAYLSVSTFQNAQVLTALNYAVDGVIGYQWFWAPGFNVDFGLGIVYHDIPPGASTSGAMSLPLTELQPELEWSLGWQF